MNKQKINNSWSSVPLRAQRTISISNQLDLSPCLIDPLQHHLFLRHLPFSGRRVGKIPMLLWWTSWERKPLWFQQRANMLKITCLKWLMSETIEQIPNLAPTKWGKLDYKSFEKIVMAASVSIYIFTVLQTERKIACRFTKVSEEEIEEAFFLSFWFGKYLKKLSSLRVGEEWWIYTLTLRVSVCIHHHSPPLWGLVV